jgi:hypothetical protein
MSYFYSKYSFKFAVLFNVTIPYAGGCSKKITAMTRKFLEGGPVMSKYHLIDWNTACSLIQSRSMGVKELCTFDQAQLGK